MLGGFTSQDGTVEFYSRVNAILQPTFKVLDLGAGRGAWHYIERSAYKRGIREFRGKVAEYIGADVDPAVLSNPTTDRNVLIQNGRLPVADDEIDLVICDWVLEHIVDMSTMCSNTQSHITKSISSSATGNRPFWISTFLSVVGLLSTAGSTSAPIYSATFPRNSRIPRLYADRSM